MGQGRLWLPLLWRRRFCYGTLWLNDKGGNDSQKSGFLRNLVRLAKQFRVLVESRFYQQGRAVQYGAKYGTKWQNKHHLKCLLVMDNIWNLVRTISLHVFFLPNHMHCMIAIVNDTIANILKLSRTFTCPFCKVWTLSTGWGSCCHHNLKRGGNTSGRAMMPTRNTWDRNGWRSPHAEELQWALRFCTMRSNPASKLETTDCFLSQQAVVYKLRYI